MEAIILAGGFGTRLAHIVKDVPKPMAPVCGHPFLEYILDDITTKGIDKIILAVGYKQEKIRDYFGYEYRGAKLIYSSEDTPLLTGGAIKKALSLCSCENVFVVNGDTYFNVDMRQMLGSHIHGNADITIAVKQMQDFDRYGTIMLCNNKITGFEEKKPTRQGLINGGIYILKNKILDAITEIKFSFETDFLEKRVGLLNIQSFKSDGYFIDIGIPEDYNKAQINFNKCVKKEKLLFGTGMRL